MLNVVRPSVTLRARNSFGGRWASSSQGYRGCSNILSLPQRVEAATPFSKVQASGLTEQEDAGQAPRTLQGSSPTLIQRKFVPEDVIKEFEMKIQGDLLSVGATLIAGVGVITWWRGVWALLDHYIEDSVFGHILCIVTGLLIILYIRFSGLKLTNFFPPS